MICARDRAQEPTVLLDDADLFEIAWGRKGSLRGVARAQAEPRFADATGKLDRYAEWARAMPFAFYARILGAEEGASASSPGSVTRRRMRSMNFSISRSNTSGARPRRCKASLMAAHGAYRGEARHGDHARRGAGDDGARCQGPGGADRRSRRHDDRAGRAAAAPTAPGSRSRPMARRMRRTAWRGSWRERPIQPCPAPRRERRREST